MTRVDVMVARREHAAYLRTTALRRASEAPLYFAASVAGQALAAYVASKSRGDDWPMIVVSGCAVLAFLTLLFGMGAAADAWANWKRANRIGRCV